MAAMTAAYDPTQPAYCLHCEERLDPADAEVTYPILGQYGHHWRCGLEFEHQGEA